MALTAAQRRHLRGLAHPLRPLVLTGAKGVTGALIDELTQVLDDHELVKVKISGEDRAAREAIVAELCARSGAELVQRIGHVATLFRRNPDRPRVELPR